MTIKELKDFLFQNYLLKKTIAIQWKIWTRKYLQSLAFKLTEKIIDPCNAKEHYQSFLKNENTKLVKQLKTIIKEPELRKTNKHHWIKTS